MRTLAALIISMSVLFAGCSTQSSRSFQIEKNTSELLVDTGIMFRRLDYIPELERDETSFTVRSSAFSVELETVSETAAHVTIRGRKNHIPYYEDFLRQTVQNTEFDTSVGSPKSLFVLFGFHILSPGFSGLYSSYENPFSGQSSPWWRFLLHTGIDAAGVMVLSTKGFQESFSFSGLSLAFLMIHRMVMLPNFMFEIDQYNRAVGGRFSFRF